MEILEIKQLEKNHVIVYVVEYYKTDADAEDDKVAVVTFHWADVVAFMDKHHNIIGQKICLEGEELPGGETAPDTWVSLHSYVEANYSEIITDMVNDLN